VREKKLSARFKAMASFINAGESVADIGTDHALLPIYLVREGVSPFAVLTDISQGPLEKARKNVESASNSVNTRGRFSCVNTKEPSPCVLDLRLGDGLSVLEPAEVDAVIIAGIGSETMISILEADPDKTGSFRKYILQPRTKTKLLETWLAGSGWNVIEKTTAEERGRLCEIFLCAPGEGKL